MYEETCTAFSVLCGKRKKDLNQNSGKAVYTLFFYVLMTVFLLNIITLGIFVNSMGHFLLTSEEWMIDNEGKFSYMLTFLKHDVVYFVLYPVIRSVNYCYFLICEGCTGMCEWKF